MSFINLLPPNELQKRIEEKKLRVILINGIVFSFVALFFLLISSYLKIKSDDFLLREKIQLEAKKAQLLQLRNLEKKISFINSTFSKVNKFYDQQLSSTKVFKEISKYFEKGMTIQAFSFSPETGNGYMLGYAPSLESLDKYRIALKEDPNFSKVSVEILGFLKSRDVSFRLDFSYGTKNKKQPNN